MDSELFQKLSILEAENAMLKQQVFELKLGVDALKFDNDNKSKLFSLQNKELLPLRESKNF